MTPRKASGQISFPVEAGGLSLDVRKKLVRTLAGFRVARVAFTTTTIRDRVQRALVRLDLRVEWGGARDLESFTEDHPVLGRIPMDFPPRSAPTSIRDWVQIRLDPGRADVWIRRPRASWDAGPFARTPRRFRGVKVPLDQVSGIQFSGQLGRGF